MENPNLTSSELTMLENCKSAREWDVICDQIKNVRNGAYPSDWWSKVVQSGMAARISIRWGDNFEMKIGLLKIQS